MDQSVTLLSNVPRETTRMNHPQGNIHFYRADEKPYGVFSNLYRSKIVVRGRVFRSVEEAYQSLKPRRAKVREWLLDAPSPRLVATTAHALTRYDRFPGWAKLRFPWMMECLRAKYTQNEQCQTLLLKTGSARLVESGLQDNATNRRWGEVNGEGENLLGRMLMKVRAEIGGAPYQDEDLDELLAGGMELLEMWAARVYPPNTDNEGCDKT